MNTIKSGLVKSYYKFQLLIGAGYCGAGRIYDTSAWRRERDGIHGALLLPLTLRGALRASQNQAVLRTLRLILSNPLVGPEPL